MPLLQQIENVLNVWADFMWGTPMVVLLVGGGLFFACYSRFKPYLHLGHSIALLRGKYADPNDPGLVSQLQALTTALSGTLGLGNIAGVAIAISVGGPGAVFWMWVTAIIGVATKFYTGTLAVMYRGEDADGTLRGGVMYVIREGMGKRWYPLAVLFALAGLIGTLPVFQANQFIQLLRDVVAEPVGWATADSHFWFDLLASSVLAVLVFVVVIGKIQRIGKFTEKLVPGMVLLYFGMAAVVLWQNAADIPAALLLIVTDAFTGQAAAGGSLGAVIMIGVRRGAFSNEAGIGTESMAHGAARTHEPVQQGIVAMLSPVIDTLIVCTCTALIILLTGVWQDGGNGEGVSLTASAVNQVLPGVGIYLLLLMVGLLSFSTIVSMWYYSTQCMSFLAGTRWLRFHTPVYVLLVVAGSVVSMDIVNGLLVGGYATMAIPTMISTLYLAPRVNAAARDYFTRLAKRDL